MPAILAALGQMLLTLTGSWVLQVITSLGVGLVAYKGVDVTLGWLKDQVIANSAALPAEMLGMMATMKVGASISIVLSAITVRLVSQGMQSGTVKRWVTK